MLKICILYDFKNTPTGGTNQFLKALKNYLISNNAYSEKLHETDVIILNSYFKLIQALNLKIKYPNKIVIHRIDGPIKMYNHINDKRDDILNIFNKYIADATILQSEWSKKHNHKMGLTKKQFETVIINAPNGNIFNTENKQPFKISTKIKIIATSWSNNMKKGFEVYHWLDENLDFSKYKMTFCGNSPIKFKNIKHIQALPSIELAKQLKQHDIYITASQNDPCSNSLIEALHCGLPAIALNSGGHPEIVKQGGKLFNKPEEIPGLLDKISSKYNYFQSNITANSSEKAFREYYNFIKFVYDNKKTTKINLTTILKLYYSYFRFKIWQHYGKK